LLPIYFSRFAVDKQKLGDFRASYLDWVLGLKEFARKRRSRIQLGAHKLWTPAKIAMGGDFRGFHDYELDTRVADDTFLLRVRHRDERDGAITWRHVVRLKTLEKSVQVEHAVAISTPRGVAVPLLPNAPRPAILSYLLKANNSGSVSPRDIDRPLMSLNADEAGRFVGHVILDPARQLPLVVVSPSRDTGEHLVDVKSLAQWMAGMASVVRLSTPEAASSLTAALRKKGYIRGHSCLDGAIRVYRPRLTPVVGSPVVLPVSFPGVTPDERLPHVAAELTRRLLLGQLQHGFLDIIETHDRDTNIRHNRMLLEAAHVSTVVFSSSQEQVEALQVDLASLRKALSDATRFQQYALEENSTLQQQKQELENESLQERDDLMQELDETRRERNDKSIHIWNLEKVMQDLRRDQEAAGVSRELAASVMNAVGGASSAEDYLRIVSVVFRDRVVVLDSAWASVKRSGEYFRPRDFWDLLVQLATNYRDALMAGKGDNEARKFFGAAFASDEGEAGNNAKAIALRTFNYRGEDVLMLKHLKKGVKDSEAKALRIHFEWMPDERVIVIGHCGPHLDHK
jgi:hypothetical protein